MYAFSYSEQAVAGVGLVSQYVFFLNLLFSVIGTGTSIVLSQYLGAEKSEEELKDIKIEGSYIIDVEGRLNEGVKDSSDKEVLADLKGFNKKEQDLLTDIINLLKEKLQSDQTKDTYNAYLYLYHYLCLIKNLVVTRQGA